jgi:acetyl-CoA carboxylase carboxyl transferase subunit beta
VQIAEPGARIGFSGQRVIEQTIREKLPEGFQKAEYLLDHGMVDMVVHRHEMRATISNLIHLLLKKPRPRHRSEVQVITTTATRSAPANGANGHANP